MKAVFLETSAVATLFYKSRRHRAPIEAVIPQGAALVSSHYVAFELSRGFVRYLIWINNRALLLKTYSELFDYCQSMRIRLYFAGAAWEIFSYFEQYLSENGVTAPNGIPMDEYKLQLFRAFIQRTIRRSWAKFHKQVSLVNKVKCRVVPGPVKESTGQISQELSKELCGRAKKCGLHDYATENRRAFESLHIKLGHIKSPDAETAKRIKSLPVLYRYDTKDFSRWDCYNCGDAIITHEAPGKVPILTLNKKHLAPIAEVFQKQLVLLPEKAAGSDSKPGAG